MSTSNIMIIGIGNHARRIYIPWFHALSARLPIKLVAGVDVMSRQASVQAYLAEKKIPLNMIYVPSFDPQRPLPASMAKELNRLIKEKMITSVIISTDPLSHGVYARWALSQGLNILMDKPVTTRPLVTTNLQQAEGIRRDFQELLRRYNALQKRKQTAFIVNTQRRYEIGFQKVFSAIREVAEKFNVPVTSIQASHADGVWIFPNEILTQECHPYTLGYGKCSHSGYHFFDAVWQMYLAGQRPDKVPDRGEVMTSFLQPQGLLSQMNQEDYRRYFGDEYKKLSPLSTKQIRPKLKDLGENDALSIVRLIRQGQVVCNISLNLLHNSFSRRSWVKPGSDLYKGNGRVKHQYFSIQQGPFQCIQIHNYQASDQHDHSTKNDFELGGKNHFDIQIFRNSAMFGVGQKPLTTFTLKNLDSTRALRRGRLVHEQAKDAVIAEFVDYILGRLPHHSLSSNIDTHAVPVNMMSAVYKSHIMQRQHRNPIARFSLR